MIDIARCAGVSPATVSLVLNPRASSVRVGESTRKRVLRIAAEMGYAQDEIARSMVTGRTRIIGWVAPAYAAEPTIRMIAGAEAAAEARGYMVKLLSYKAEQAEQLEQTCISHRLCGVVCAGAALAPSLIYRLSEGQRQDKIGALVLLDNSGCEEAPVHICSDDEGGMREAWRHLRALGHRAIGFLGGPVFEHNFQLRQRTYEKLVWEEGRGGRPWSVVAREWSQAALEEAAARLLQGRHRPTGVLCASDRHAAALLRVAHREGWRLPAELSVVGFANLSLSELTYPAITTVEQSFEVMGQRAATAVIDRVERAATERPPEERIWLRIPTRLVLRESTAAPGRRR